MNPAVLCKAHKRRDEPTVERSCTDEPCAESSACPRYLYPCSALTLHGMAGWPLTNALTA